MDITICNSAPHVCFKQRLAEYNARVDPFSKKCKLCSCVTDTYLECYCTKFGYE